MSDPYADFATEAPVNDPYSGIATAASDAPLHTFSTRAPNGKTVSFQAPADSSDDDIRRLAVQATGSRIYGKSTVKRDGTPLPKTDDSAANGFLAGVRQPMDKLAGWLDTDVGHNIEVALNGEGHTTRDVIAQHAAERDNNSRTGYQTLGNIAGTAPLALVPGANTAAGLALSGAASGALLSNKTDLAGTALDAGEGAAGSLAGGVVLRGVGALARGVQAPAARALHAAGVPLTLGQIGRAANNTVGRIVGGVEERLAGFPVVGDIINNARNRGVDAYNRAVLGRALGAVGEQVPADTQTGRDMIRYVGDRLSSRYQQLLPQLSATPDAQFQQGMNQAIAATRTLPNQTQRQYAQIINDALPNRAPGGVIQSGALKDAEEKLNDLATQYSSSGDVDQRRLGQALGMARDQLRALVERSNPQHQGELQALNRGWAQLATAESAAGRVGNTDGVFTPKAYASADRAADSSVRKRATVRGTRPNQAVTDAAADILPNRTPDSGTAGRWALGALMSGGGGLAAMHPAGGAAVVAGALPYTALGQRALNAAAFGNRPAAVQAASIPLRNLARYAPQIVTPLVVQPQQ